MKNALFVIHNSPDTRASEFATLAALASAVASAGYTSDLLVLNTTGSASVTIKHGNVFRAVSAIAPESPVGDGAEFLVHAVGKAVADASMSLVVGLGTIANRNWAPQVAASLSAEYLTACEAIEAADGGLRVTAPVMGAMVQKSVSLGDRKAVLLYSGEALAPSSGTDVDAQVSSTAVEQGRARFIASEALPDTGGIPLRGASRVVSGGLGVGSADKWQVIEQFAAKVGAAVGASRAAVEMGWVPSSRQVGFSGQKVSPDVYVAVGISGAVHHLAGIGGAKKIIAINKDPEAGIFKVADIGIVGDYEQILSAAMRKL
ncbi:electron transfer flavoprotein subunit alpha/FixB family protein [Sinorhizobium mexicanum]|uniref:Electron transfer flavoprotein subunit alpha/FixB family protein n=1 Tax=Sinorhizobium mexicanum TaxID=375549 RepID=A0A859QI23_9HYPH|nr:electron transfer flavoprotein subunit alpha/FixB family protein [Sinorhizobium mexicanum]MBP1881773.1 electron transfer flavoprotein alpha subunit [Sinorhizobium mexicanum]QLL61530.1 electron transfer flavoprotein subunit alpha/FixB family protein [Sinorhizobium mexicanum]